MSGLQRPESKPHFDRFALLILFLQGSLTFLFYDLSILGLDQIRDLRVAQAIAAGEAFPLLGPAFQSVLKLGPATYYFAALPLLIWNDVQAITVFFGLLNFLSHVILWLTIKNRLGSAIALLAVSLSFPFLLYLYAYSAWSPALIYPASNILLAGFIILLYGQRNLGWLIVWLSLALIVQFHPSSIPIVCGIFLYACWQPNTLFYKGFGYGMVLFVLLFSPWIYFELSHDFPHLKAALSMPGKSTADNQHNLFQIWRDALLLPYRAIQGFVPPFPFASTTVAVYLISIAVGWFSALFFRSHRRIAFWSMLSALLWMVISMAYINVGFNYYLDLLYPWVFISAAIGLYGLLQISKVPLLPVTLLLAGLKFFPVAIIYQSLSTEGYLIVRFDYYTFPKADYTSTNWPLLAEKYDRDYKQFLHQHHIHPNMVTGLNSILFRNYNAHYHASLILEPDKPFDQVYFFTSSLFEGPFNTVADLQPIYQGGSNALYKINTPAVRINGITSNYIHDSSTTQENHITVQRDEPFTVLRIAFACRQPLADPSQWFWSDQQQNRFTSNTSKVSTLFNEYYYDLELRFGDAKHSLHLNLPQQVLQCAISAFAR